MSRHHASAEQRFRCLCAEHVDPILGFAMRRADQADDADPGVQIEQTKYRTRSRHGQREKR